MAVSAILTVAGLIFCKLFIKEERNKKTVLKVSGLLTVFIHSSILYVDFFTYGSAEVESSFLIPVYPCNVVMWLLVICAFSKSETSKFKKVLFEFTFYAGVVCGIIGIVFNVNYAHSPSLADYFSLKGLLSHSTMVFGCLYILVGDFIKIDVSNCISVFCGLCLFLVDGVIVNGLYNIFGLDPCNSMYLLEAPFADYPWLNTYAMGLMALALAFIITSVYEFIAFNKEDRTLYKLFAAAKAHREAKLNHDGEVK